MLCRVTQDRQVMVESSDKTWSTGEGNGKPIQYSCLENPMNKMKRQKHMRLKYELPRSGGAQYATWEEWRNSPRKNENQNPENLTNLITWTIALSNSMKPWGLPMMEESWWRVLIKRGPLEKGMASHFLVLALRTSWKIWKSKKLGHWKVNSPGQVRAPICYRSVEK